MVFGSYTAERKPKGFQSLTVSTTAVALTVPAGASRAVVKVIAQPVRFRDDGTDPTSSVGYSKVANDEFELVGPSMKDAKFIRSAGTDATLEVLYYGA